MKHLFPGFLPNTLQVGLALVISLLSSYVQGQTVVFSEDFEQWSVQTPSLPIGWLPGSSFCSSDSSCFWAVPQDFDTISSPATGGCEGSNLYARANTSGIGNADRISMISPAIDLSTIDTSATITLSFCLINPGIGLANTLEVLISRNGGANWQSGVIENTRYDAWTRLNFTIPKQAWSANFRIRLDAYGSGDALDLGVDELLLSHDAPTCMSGNSTVSSNISGQICRNDLPDDATFSNDGPGNAEYDYILVDPLDRIMGVFPSDQVDLNILRPGDYRVYGISYSGVLRAPPGQLIQNATASICHTLSSNFISFFVVELGLDSQISDYDGYQVSVEGGNDGRIEILVPANSNYTYSWDHDANLADPVADNLPVGEYVVLVDDTLSGCDHELRFTLESPPALVGSIETVSDYNGFDISCPGGDDGEIKASIRGGVKPYTYDWESFMGQNDSTLSGLNSGSYRLVVTDKYGAELILDKELLSPPPISIEGDTTFYVCYQKSGGTLTPTISGGAGNYSYLWPDGSDEAIYEDQLPGTYTLTVTDENSCIQDFELELEEAPEIEIDPIVESPDCHEAENGSILLFTTGGVPPYSFEWSHGADEEEVGDLAAGSYEVKIVDDLGCEFIQTFELNNPDSIQYTLELFPDQGDGSGAARISASGPNGPYTYLWSTGERGPEVNELSIGAYEVTIFDDGTCSRSVGFEIEPGERPICLDIHMGFSPNGDGINDFFEIPCLIAFPENEVQILNRWGQELFYMVSYDNSWAGTSNGKALAEGIYYYVVSLKGPDGTRTYKGSLSIIK